MFIVYKEIEKLNKVVEKNIPFQLEIVSSDISLDLSSVEISKEVTSLKNMVKILENKMKKME